MEHKYGTGTTVQGWLFLIWLDSKIMVFKKLLDCEESKHEWFGPVFGIWVPIVWLGSQNSQTCMVWSVCGFGHFIWILNLPNPLFIHKYNLTSVYIYRGRIKYKPLYLEILELLIDNYHGAIIKLRYIWKLIIFIHYDHSFILGNKIELNIF